MRDCIMVGCDLHEESMLLKIAVEREKAVKRHYVNSKSGRKKMLFDLRRQAKDAGDARVVFAYEASCLGFGLYDELTEAGIECYVLAPTRIARSPKHTRNKTDERDADRLLELLRGHVLAGNELPSIWVPDKQTRDDRELVRARLEAAVKVSKVKTQVHFLLKRHGIEKPSFIKTNWSRKHRSWLGCLCDDGLALSVGACIALRSLLRQLKMLEREVELLDDAIEGLAEEERYCEAARALMSIKGVGLLTAMVFLTEMGELSRFSNRRQIGSYLGLVPASSESGQGCDRKGHITAQGPPRVRKMLCQASWAHVRLNGEWKPFHERIVAKNPKHKKIATVAVMRRLATQMWHVALSAQQGSNSYSAICKEAA